LALTNASAGILTAKVEPARSVRLVLLARALERNNFFDSAAATYTRAAVGLPSVRDWLRLRAAGSQSDSAQRARTTAAVTIPAAKTRVPWTDAQARERFKDALGAATRFAALGNTFLGLANVLVYFSRHPTPPTPNHLAAQLAETTVVPFVSFACLSAAWLLVAFGMRRQV